MSRAGGIVGRTTFTIFLGLLCAGFTACGPKPEAENVADSTPKTRKSLPITTGRLNLDLSQGPEVKSAPSTIRFRDITESSGITFVHCSGDDDQKHFPTANGSGVSLIDYDGDGFLDLYFTTTRHFPLDGPTTSQGNRLYRNNGDGTFEDVTEAAGVGYHGFTHTAAVGDVNNNGYPDLFLTNFGPNVLYLNNGDGTFTEAPNAFPDDGPSWSSGAAFVDFDGDGHLDLYVSCYGEWTIDDNEFCGDYVTRTRMYCTPLKLNPTRDYLYRNRGDGTFEDVTASAGILRSDGRGMGVLALDVNRNGLTDLYVANDLSPNYLFLNNGDGTFSDVSELSGAAASEAGIHQAGMGVDGEDLTGDGLPELFVTNFRNDYNTLYRNLDGQNVQDVTAATGTVKDSTPGVGWGCALADFDNDGLPDMLVVNGHVDDNLDLFDMPNVPKEQLDMVWKGLGGLRFQHEADPGPYFQAPHVSRGAAFGDLNNNGRIDVVISLMDERPAVLLNESDAGNWIRFELVGRRSNRSAVGAVVETHVGDTVLHRQLKGGGSYHSANDPRVHVGLGAAEAVDRVEIQWPSGLRTTLNDLEINQTHRVEEPDEDPEPSDHPDDSAGGPA